jgi:hypothetical protein
MVYRVSKVSLPPTETVSNCSSRGPSHLRLCAFKARWCRPRLAYADASTRMALLITIDARVSVRKGPDRWLRSKQAVPVLIIARGFAARRSTLSRERFSPLDQHGLTRSGERGRFVLLRGQRKVVPLAFRAPVRSNEWFLFDQVGNKHFVPANPIKMILRIYGGVAPGNALVFLNTDAGWNVFPSVKTVPSDHCLGDQRELAGGHR